MITEQDVYFAFRKAQANANDRGFRMPKDWDAFLAKMNANNLNWLKQATMYFNTKYCNLDLDRYMECGFEVWKSFSYKHFLHDKVIQLYIEKDKIKKRQMEVSQREIETTFNNIADYMRDKPMRPGYTELQSFCKFRQGELRILINMYVQGSVDLMTLTYCVNRGYIQMTDDERALSPYLVQRYRDLVLSLEDVKPFIMDKERELDERHGR
jgi:hypothetical protein